MHYFMDNYAGVPEPIPELLSTKVLYVEGYFITHSYDTALQVRKVKR